MPSALILAVQAEPAPFLSVIPLVLMFVIFYFVLIRPQQKKQDEHKKLLSALQKNQEVVTLGGIHGTIVGLKDDVVSLRIAENVKVDVERAAISHVKK